MSIFSRLRATLRPDNSHIPPDAVPLPWNVTEEDKATLSELSTGLRSTGLVTTVTVRNGQYGQELTLIAPQAQPDNPLALLSRLWDPERKHLVSMLVFSGTGNASIERYLASKGFMLLGKQASTGALFVRPR